MSPPMLIRRNWPIFSPPGSCARAGFRSAPAGHPAATRAVPRRERAHRAGKQDKRQQPFHHHVPQPHSLNRSATHRHTHRAGHEVRSQWVKTILKFDGAVEIKHGLPGHHHTIRFDPAVQDAATFRRLQRHQLVTPKPLGPVRREPGMDGAGNRVLVAAVGWPEVAETKSCSLPAAVTTTSSGASVRSASRSGASALTSRSSR